MKQKIKLFSIDPDNQELNNHPLKREWTGYRSIDIISDWRAIYKEVELEEGEPFAYFVALGTHRQLYSKPRSN